MGLRAISERAAQLADPSGTKVFLACRPIDLHVRKLRTVKVLWNALGSLLGGFTPAIVRGSPGCDTRQIE
jgi:hypothetical protein